MNLLITGSCGFVGSTLIRHLLDVRSQFPGGLTIIGVDNLARPGSEINRAVLKRLGVSLFHGDLRLASDVDPLPPVDWVIDASANPSVLAGVDGSTSSRQIMDHNLVSTLNLLEYCKAHRAGFMLLSTSRVYAIKPLAGLPMRTENDAFVLDTEAALPEGVSAHGISESFSTTPPLSLYGTSKLASEALALEYGSAFDFDVWINRCGVLAGAGQFGRADQGIFSFWIHSYLRRQPLKYIGFGGHGYQVRDCLHPRDLVPVLAKQFAFTDAPETRIFNFGGGVSHALSLRQLSAWCAKRFGPHPVTASPAPRPFDLPWVVMDSRSAEAFWNWRPTTSATDILEEIARHAEDHPGWLELSAPG